MVAGGSTFAILGFDAALATRPFYRVRFGREELAALQAELTQIAATDRAWHTLAATYDKPERIRFKRDATPGFESDAAPLYVRGEVFRVSGREGTSFNLSISNHGAAALARCLAEARSRMRRFVEVRVPSRKRDIVEVIPDVDLEAQLSAEHAALAEAGALAAAEVLPEESFADWEE